MFELHEGESSDQSTTIDRTEFFGPAVAYGQTVTTTYGLSVEAENNTASFAIVGQWHGGDSELGRNPYLAFSIESGQLVLRAKYFDPSGDALQQSDPIILYQAPMVFGIQRQFSLTQRVDPTDGYVSASINGVVVASYTGPLGYWVESELPYWKFGIYRAKDPGVLRTTYVDMTHTPSP